MIYHVSLTSPFSVPSAVLPVLCNALRFQLQQFPLSAFVLPDKGGLSVRLGLQPRLSMLSVLAWCRSLNALSDTVPLGHTVQARCGSIPHILPVSSAWSAFRSCGNPDIADIFPLALSVLSARGVAFPSALFRCWYSSTVSSFPIAFPATRTGWKCDCPARS